MWVQDAATQACFWCAVLVEAASLLLHAFRYFIVRLTQERHAPSHLHCCVRYIHQEAHMYRHYVLHLEAVLVHLASDPPRPVLLDNGPDDQGTARVSKGWMPKL